ncbi:hypothetical protein ACWEKR_34545 [Nocardia sp. NPDC004573]
MSDRLFLGRRGGGADEALAAIALDLRGVRGTGDSGFVLTSIGLGEVAAQ